MTPVAVIRLTENLSPYPFFFKDGTVIFPIAATQATLDPDITPKTSQAAIVAIPNDPRIAPTIERIVSISRRAMPPRT